jgi:hypothetical protein
MGEYADQIVDSFIERGMWKLPRVARRRRCRDCGKGGLHWDQLPRGRGYRLSEKDGSPHVCERDYFKDLKERQP